MRSTVRVAIALATVACSRAQDSAPPAAAPAPPDSVSAEFVAADTAQVVAFLEFLKSGEDAAARSSRFSVVKGGYWKKDQAIAFLDSTGVTFFDTTGDTTWHESVASIRSKLVRRSGASFTMLVHLGHIYGQSEPQYSALKFAPDSAGVVVNVGDWYRLTFVRRDDSLRVAKVEYVMKEFE